MDSVLTLLEDSIGLGRQGVYKLGASFALAIGLLIINRILKRVVGRLNQDPKSAFRMRKVVGYSTGILAGILIGAVWLESVSSLTTFLGLLSAGIAIALRDVIADIAGWAFILLRKPFNLEDRIESMGIKGDVIDIRLFKTTLLEIGNWVDAEQSTGRVVHLPNKFIFSEAIANYSRGFRYIWNEIKVLITFESDWERAKTLLRGIVDRHGAVHDAKTREALKEASGRFLISYNIMTPTVYTSVRDSGVLLTLRYLCEPRERRKTEEAAIWEDILRAFALEERIDLAYSHDPVLRLGRKGIARLALSLSGAAQYLLVLVHVELLELVAGRPQVLAGVELVRFLGEDLADQGRHGQAAVGVDVDLADGALGGLAQLLLGDVHGIGKLAAVLL